jgi:hypothetical protein
LKDELFKPHDTHYAQWLNFMVKIHSQLAAEGIELHTWDMFPLSEADAIISQDLPLYRAEMAQARKKAPQAKFVLQVLETPLDRSHHQDPANHDLFDAVLTYNRHQADNRRYFHYWIPIAPPAGKIEEIPFSERRSLVMINSNRLTRIFGQRQPGLGGLPGFGPMFCGWHVPLSSLLHQGQGQLYSRRRHLALVAERIDPNLLDIYGPGWRGERIGWFHKIVPHRRYACAKGPTSGWKFDYLRRYRFTIAFENIRSNVGYISEKIFDSLFAGTVPIYLGDEQITDAVPTDCFVDARKFSGDRELLEFARDCPESEWRRMRDAGRDFLKSPQFEKFSAESLGHAMIGVLRGVTKKSGSEPARSLDAAASRSPSQS